MAELAGYLNEVFILAGTSAMTGSTGAKVLGVDNATFNRLCDMLEITQFGDTVKRRIAGLKDSSLSLSGNYYPGDTTGQDELVPGDSVYIGIYPQGPTVAGSQIPAIVESFAISSTPSGKQTFTASLQGTGAVVTLPAQT